MHTITTAVLVMTAVVISSGQPNWVFNPGDYEFSMTVSGIAVLDCIENLDENDIVGAFVDGNLQGVQTFDTPSEGHAFAFLIVYDSVVVGNQVDFKVWDASEDQVLEIQETVSFEDNAQFGSFAEPYVFSNGQGVVHVSISSDSIPDHTLSGTTVAEFHAFKDSNEVAASYAFIDGAGGRDNDRFSIQENTLIILENVDKELQSDYQIHVQVNTEEMCSAYRIFSLFVSVEGTVAVKNVNEKKNQLQIFPNPAKNLFSVSGNIQPGGLRLVDMTGRVLLSVHLEDQQEIISIEDVPAGCYIALFESKDYSLAQIITVLR